MYQLFKSKFFRSFSIYFSGALAGKAVGLINLLLLGHLLNPSLFASYVIFFMVCDFLGVFAIFGLTSGMMRIIWDDRKIILSNGLFIIFILSSVLLIATILVKTFFENILSSSFDNYYFINDVLLYIPFSVFVSSLGSLISTYYNAIEKPVRNTITSLIGSVIFLLSLFAIKYLDFGDVLGGDILLLIIVCRIISMIISGVFAIFLSRKHITISSVSIKKSISIMKQTSVFLSKHIIGIFQTQATLIVLGVYSNSTIFGIFAYYNTIIAQISLLVGAFFKTYTPKIVNILHSKIDDRYKNVNRLVKKSLFYYIILSPLFLLCTYFAIKIILIYPDQFSGLINKGYISELRLFYFMLFAWVVGNIRSFIDIWQYENKKYVNHFIIIIQIIVLFILYFGAIYFFKQYGVMGIIINQFIMYFVTIIIHGYCYKRFIIKVGLLGTKSRKY